MKKLFILLICVSFFSTQAQDLFKLSDDKKDYYFENIHEVEFDKKTINAKALEWIAMNFNDSNNVIKSKTEDKVIVKGLFDVEYSAAGTTMSSNANFNLIIDFKDKKFRVRVKDITLTDKTYNTSVPFYSYVLSSTSFEDFKEAYRKQVESQTDKQVKKYMLKALKNEKALKQTYDMAQGVNQSIVSRVKSYCKDLDKELATYVIKGDPDKDKW